MLTPTTPDSSKIAKGRQDDVVDMSFAEMLDEDEFVVSDKEEEFDVLRFCPIPFNDQMKSDASVEDRIDTASSECGGELDDYGKLCVEARVDRIVELTPTEEENSVNAKGREDRSACLQHCEEVIEDL